MENIYKYNTLKTQRDTYFIGANSEKGFVFASPELFDEKGFEKCFILKGSAGGGKNTFMKKAADLSEKLGYKVTEYRCSSDPYSLDAVIISDSEKRILIVDGTSPHSIDADFPCAITDVTDLSVITSGELLKEKRDRVIELVANKKEAFSKAYSCFASASPLTKIIERESEKASDIEKMRNYLERFASKLDLKKGKARKEYLSAYSMRGKIKLSTYYDKAQAIYGVTHFMEEENVFLRILCDVLSEYKASYSLIPAPFDSSVLESVYIDGAEVLVTRDTGEVAFDKKINVKRFIREENIASKGVVRFLEKYRKELLEMGMLSLKEAEKSHFALEDIYITSSDYTKADEIFENTIAKYIKKRSAVKS